MLKTAIEYSKAIKRICSDADNGLRDFELSTEEWTIAEQLRDALEVRLSASQSATDVGTQMNIILTSLLRY